MKKYSKYKDSGIAWIGEIPEHWEARKIGRIFTKIGSGTTPKSGNDDYYAENGENWLQTGDLNDSYIYETSKKITKKAVDEHSLRFYPEGSIVMAMYGATIGKLGLLSIDTTTNQACCVMSGNKVCHNKYAFNALLAARTHILTLAYGGGQPNISQDTIKNIKLPTPSIPEQEQIAKYLDWKCGEVDRIVDVRERQIKLLGELRTSVISRAVTRGLDPNAPLKDSGIEWIGQIPEHWEVGSYKRCMKINNGQDYKHIVATEGVPVIGSGGQFAFSSDYMYEGEVVFLGRKGTVDKPMYYNGKFWAVDTMFYSIPNYYAFCKYMYYQALTFPFNRYSTATALPSMTQNDLANNQIAIPTINEQQQIADYLDKKTAEIDSTIEKFKAQIDKIKEYRQALITEVVTGKIDVRGIEIPATKSN